MTFHFRPVHLTLPFILLAAACQPAQLPPLRSELVFNNTGLVVDLDFSPDGRLFFATRQGVVSSVDPAGNGAMNPAELLHLDVSLDSSAESGLLGLAISPDFAKDHQIFIHYILPDENGNPAGGRISRFTVREGQASGELILVDKLPNRPDQQFHFGGGLAFGPDGKLYLIFGDTNLPAEAQNPASLFGSILRYNPDGSIPLDNPFPGSPVYAFGIRNGFGLAWDPKNGQLYETENGTQCDDELNLIEPGANFGWGTHPFDTCPYPDDHASPPIFQWNPVSAPAGLAFYTGDRIPEWKGDLLVCGFNRRELFHFSLGADGREIQNVELVQVPGMGYTCRVALAEGPDGWLYVSTDNALYRVGR